MHVARLLLTVLYIAPLAAITWHTLTEKLSTYRRIYFPEDTPSQDNKPRPQTFPRAVSPKSCGPTGNTASNTLTKMFTMSTRYWDEIDWCIQEGALKYCEMLKSENEDASSAQWSTGEEEDFFTQQNEESLGDTGDATKENIKYTDAENITEKFDNISLRDAVSDGGDSLKDEEDYTKRSTSVEDEKTAIIDKQTNVDELMSVCAQCEMMPPIYTYFTTGNEQVVSTVQLWNGVRFSSHPQTTRDEAMGEAAGHALEYLKSELRQNRPVRTSPPVSVPPYCFQNYVQSVVHHQQCYAPHPVYAPATYLAASPQPYFVPSVPYAVLPHTSAVTIPSEYPRTAIVHPQYSLSPHHHNPYTQLYPFVRLQASPSHQSKGGASYHYISPGAKPAVWTAYPKNLYLIQDKEHSLRTEYKVLDEPPTLNSPTVKDSCHKAESPVNSAEEKGHFWKQTPQRTNENVASKSTRNKGKPTVSKLTINISQ